MYEAALSVTQRLRLALSIQETLVIKLHQLIRSVIFYWPEAHHQRGRSGSQKCTSQTQLLVTSAAQRQARFTTAQGNQLTSLQIQAECVDSIELSICETHKGKIRGIQPATTMSCQVNNWATWSFIDEASNRCFVFKIAMAIQKCRHCPCFFNGTL